MCCLSGCFGEDYGTPGMMIWNQTDAPVEVYYRRPMGPTEVEFESLVQKVGANQGVSVIGPHQTEGPCLRGLLVAIQAGREIAALSQPCEGTEWFITPPDG